MCVFLSLLKSYAAYTFRLHGICLDYYSMQKDTVACNLNLMVTKTMKTMK